MTFEYWFLFPVALLEAAARSNCMVGLTTMSHCDQVKRILRILNMVEAFDFVATRDDMKRGST